MRIGVPTETKDSEYRVAMTPAGVETLVEDGHEVVVERGAGLGTSIEDAEYAAAGARLAHGSAPVFSECELIVKVKEPLPAEQALLRRGQALFTYFHFAASEELTRAMVASGAICIAYETIQLADGTLPLLTPMSEVAGRMAIQEGAKFLERPMEGRGILLSGVPGVPPARVVILGGGIVGANAAKVAAGFGADVTIIDVNLERLRYLDDIMPWNVNTLYSNRYNIRQAIREADLVIGSVLRRGAKAQVLVTREMIRTMKKGAVVIDVAVDQGGCFETTRPTTHSEPTYIVDGVVHYCVTNMPGAVAGTSTYALTNVTLPYVRRLARYGWREAARRDPALRMGLNVVDGHVCFPDVAEQFGLPCVPVEQLLN
ncbi:MAG TPA: alanine dehydrogenase [Chthonomonadales bacterium]|nr:alanine dehydrogenase [Chthonomonadales bacterium]